MSDATWNTDDLASVQGVKFNGTLPKSSDWECRMTPGPYGLVLNPCEGGVPNAFHRFMQRVCFGFRWQKKGSC
jgi:hypothetical protein